MDSNKKEDDTKNVQGENSPEKEETEPQHDARAKKKKPPSPKKRDSDDDLGVLDPELEAYVGDGAEGGINPWEELTQETAQADATEEDDEEEEGEEEEEEEEDEVSDDAMSEMSEEFVWVSEDDFVESDEESREQRRYLLSQQSFIHLVDPGLDKALIPKEELDALAAASEEYQEEKVRRGVKGERDAYKKSCQELGIIPMRKFMEAFRKKVLDLSHYRLNATDLKPICKSLEDNHHIIWVSFEANPAGDEGGEAIASLIENNSSILYLNIASTETACAMPLIFWALARNTALEVLDISKNDLEDDDMECISQFFATSVTLRELNLSRNHIGDKGLKILSEGLLTNAALEILDLSWNVIRGNKMAMPFFNAAAQLRTLRILNLGHNYMLDKCANGISRILSMSETIEHLDVSLARMNDASGPLIARGVQKTIALKSLNLELQNWRQHAVAGIVAATTNPNSQMEYISFGQSFNVHKQFLNAESRALRFHPDLKIKRGQPFGLYKAISPDPKLLVIRRANVVCRNFGTPLEMLIDELRTEENILNQKQFKKFIKSCNLYKDKVMTESFMRVFAHAAFDVNCEAIIEAFDQVYKQKPVAPTDPRQKLLADDKDASKPEESDEISEKKEDDNAANESNDVQQLDIENQDTLQSEDPNVNENTGDNQPDDLNVPQVPKQEDQQSGSSEEEDET